MERLFLTCIYAEGFCVKAAKSRTICVAIIFATSLWLLDVALAKIVLVTCCAVLIRTAPISVRLIETAAVSVFLFAIYQELRGPLGSFALAAVP